MKVENRENRLLIVNQPESNIKNNAEIYFLGFYNNKSNFPYHPLVYPFYTPDAGSYFTSLLNHLQIPAQEEKEFDFLPD